MALYKNSKKEATQQPVPPDTVIPDILSPDPVSSPRDMSDPVEQVIQQARERVEAQSRRIARVEGEREADYEWGDLEADMTSKHAERFNMLLDCAPDDRFMDVYLKALPFFKGQKTKQEVSGVGGKDLFPSIYFPRLPNLPDNVDKNNPKQLIDGDNI